MRARSRRGAGRRGRRRASGSARARRGRAPRLPSGRTPRRGSSRRGACVRARSTNRTSVSSSLRSCGVHVPRTSSHGAKAETTRESGPTTSRVPLPSFQAVRIDIESLPTGMPTPRRGHSSRATARTVSKRAASSPGDPAAAIQLAESLTRESDATGAAARFVRASPTAMRPDAGPSTTATGERSPIANASPAYPSNDRSVVAQSATGTCHGPTIGSREHRPPTVRSPIVTRNVLSATAGWRSTRCTASATSMPSARNGSSRGRTRRTSRVMRGGLPRSAGRSMSTGRFPNSGSSTTRRASSVATPTTANGHRSRSQMSRKAGRRSGAMART